MSDRKFNPDFADVLLSENRKQQLPQQKIIDYLDITSQDIIADLGSGNGYFTIPLAQEKPHLVFAVDMEPKMLDLLRKQAEKEEILIIEYVQSPLENVNLPDKIATKVLLSLVLHEVDDLQRTIQEAKRILQPVGQMFIIEWKAVESEEGPPVRDRIPAEKLEAALKHQHLRTSYIELNESQYAISARLDAEKEI